MSNSANIEKYLQFNPHTFEHDEMVGYDQLFYGPMVYFLYLEANGKKRLLYIGQTIRGYERMQEHEMNRHIPFSEWLYIPVPEELLKAVEAHYIRTYQPILNYFGNPLYMWDEKHYKVSSKEFHRFVEYFCKRIGELMTERV